MLGPHIHQGHLLSQTADWTFGGLKFCPERLNSEIFVLLVQDSEMMNPRVDKYCKHQRPLYSINTRLSSYWFMFLIIHWDPQKTLPCF